jgi:hypothetical protein
MAAVPWILGSCGRNHLPCQDTFRTALCCRIKSYLYQGGTASGAAGPASAADSARPCNQLAGGCPLRK